MINPNKRETNELAQTRGPGAAGHAANRSCVGRTFGVTSVDVIPNAMSVAQAFIVQDHAQLMACYALCLNASSA